MFHHIDKACLEDKSLHNFSLFSSKQEGSTDRTVECVDADTEGDPFCSPMRENSPYLGIMVNQLLSTPEKITRGKTEACSDRMMEEEFKNLDLEGEQQSMCTWNTNLNLNNSRLSDSNKVAYLSGLFSGSKYCQAFDSETKRGIRWNEMSVRTSVKIPRLNDICCASPEGSGLSISLAGSISISPTNEFSEEVRRNVSAHLQTHPMAGEVPLQFGKAKRCGKVNNYWQKQGNGKELGNRKNRGKPTRRNGLKRWYKRKKFRTSTDQRKFRVTEDNVSPTLPIG